MRESKQRALSTIEIFQDLSPQEVEDMDRTIRMSSCERGRVFFRPEESGEVLFLLKSGRVQLYRLSPEGKKLVVATLDGGAIFGEMAFVGQGMHNTFAEALDDCSLCVMSQQDVERLLIQKPQVAIRLMQAMANRLKNAESQLEDIAFKSIPSRLAAQLLSLTEDGPYPTVVQGYTHQDLAEMVGTYRETATQILNQFKEQGWIEIGRKRLAILNREALEGQARR